MTPSLPDLIEFWIKEKKWDNVNVERNDYEIDNREPFQTIWIERKDERRIRIFDTHVLIWDGLSSGFYRLNAADPEFFKKLEIEIFRY